MYHSTQVFIEKSDLSTLNLGSDISKKINDTEEEEGWVFISHSIVETIVATSVASPHSHGYLVSLVFKEKGGK